MLLEGSLKVIMGEQMTGEEKLDLVKECGEEQAGVWKVDEDAGVRFKGVPEWR